MTKIESTGCKVFLISALLVLLLPASAAAAGRTISVADLYGSARWEPPLVQPQPPSVPKEPKTPAPSSGRWVSAGDLLNPGSYKPPLNPTPEKEPEEPSQPDPVVPDPLSPPQATPPSGGKWISAGDLMNPRPPQPSTPKNPMEDLPPIPPGLTAAEGQMLQYLNQERIAAGLPPLDLDMELVRLARMKAQDVTNHNYNGHNSPTYGTPSYMVRQAGVQFTRLGETIVKAGDPYKGHKLLLGSSQHKKIMLSPDYKRIGIGVDYYDGRHNTNGLVAVHFFAD